MAQIIALYRMPCPSGFAFEAFCCIKRGEKMDVQIECAEHIEEVTAIAGEMIDEGALFVIDEEGVAWRYLDGFDEPPLDVLSGAAA